MGVNNARYVTLAYNNGYFKTDGRSFVLRFNLVCALPAMLEVIEDALFCGE
jgi:hypothetical protein